MQVHLVRSGPPGCEPHCTEWIAAQGQIDKSTPGQFKKVFAQLGNRKLPILIHSGGGSVDDAIAIGRMIRAKGLDVAVTKTEFAPCAPTDTACRKKVAKGGLIGTPKARQSVCASACPLIVAGGVRRYIGPWTGLGLHQITSYQTHIKVFRTYQVTTRKVWGAPVEVKRTLIGEQKIAEKTVKTETKAGTYENVRQHFVAMGVDDSVMPLLMATPSTSIRWLSRAELLQTRMATDIVMTGETVIAAAFPPKTEPAPPENPAATSPALAPPAETAAVGPIIVPNAVGAQLPCAQSTTNQSDCVGMTIPSWAQPTSIAPATIATPSQLPPTRDTAAASVVTPAAAPLALEARTAAATPTLSPAEASPPRPRKIEKPRPPAVSAAKPKDAGVFDFDKTR